MTPFKLKIVTPDRVFFDGETEQIVVRTTEGDVGILANHIDYVANISAGPLSVKNSEGEFRIAAVAGGVITVSKKQTTILATAVEWKDEIDVERAKKSEEEAKTRLKKSQSEKEFERASLRLKRALNRINIADK
ncbi:MAG: ATP synthase F1 subunit epsilon [Oscillospiraceae bacterium]|jgi:F-type H+-transporting ATPase subunit epsilon